MQKLVQKKKDGKSSKGIKRLGFAVAIHLGEVSPERWACEGQSRCCQAG